MRVQKPAIIYPLRIAQVPLPAYPVLGNIKPGGVLLSGELASAVDSLKLDTRDMPPSRFKSVRDDISRYSPIPVSRVALRRGEHAYVGIIDSNNEPFIFSLNSQGLLLKRAQNDENAWQLFDQYMEAERSVALRTRRKVAAAEQATLVIKADIKRPGTRGGKFYFDRRGKVRYGQQSMHDHHVHVSLPVKHELEGDAAALHKHVRKQNPATVHEARRHIRSWIKNNYDASTKQVDHTTAQMLRYFHEEGALHLHQPDVEPTASLTKDVPHFFKKREALVKPVLPTPFDVQGTRLIVNGSPVRLSADAEHACYAFAKRFIVNEGKVKGHAEFVRGFEKSLRSMGVPKGDYDYSNFVERITSEPEKEKTLKNKEQPTPKTHPHLFIKQDEQFVRLSDVRTPAGNFYTGKGKRGTWARALREEDITMNVTDGSAPDGWRGKVTFDPTKDYYLTWRHPDTDEIGYVYPSRASAYQKKFEEASKLGLNIDRIREGVVRDIEKRGSMQNRVAALCTYLIDKEHFRVGEESHAEDTGTFGIGSLRVEHVKVDGKHVIFDFPGKKDEPWRRVVDFSEMPEALHIIKDCLAQKHNKDRVWEELGGGWSVDSKAINEYLDGYSKDGVKFTAKMFRTFHANKYMKKMLDTLETLAAHHGWDDATVKKLYKGFKVNDKAGKKLLNMTAPGGGTVREALGLEENHGAKGKGKAIIGVLPTIATKLGHTVSSCRNSYIDPVLVTPFGAKHGWDERTLGEKKTRDDLPVFEKKHVAKPAKQLNASKLRKSIEITKALPYGHVAYVRHTKTGKLVQVKAKGVKPVHVNAQAPFLAHPDQQPFHPKKNERDYKVWRTVHDAKPQTYEDTVHAIHGAIKQHFGVDDEALTDNVIEHFQEEGAMHAPDYEPDGGVDDDDTHIDRNYLRIDHGKHVDAINEARAFAHDSVMRRARHNVYEAHGIDLYVAHGERLFRERKQVPPNGFTVDEHIHRQADQAALDAKEEANRAGNEAANEAETRANKEVEDAKHANEMLRQGLVTFEKIDPTPVEHAIQNLNAALPKAMSKIDAAVKDVGPAMALFSSIENILEDEPEHEDVPKLDPTEIGFAENELSEVNDLLNSVREDHGLDLQGTLTDIEPDTLDLPELPDEPEDDDDDEQYVNVLKQRASILYTARLNSAEQSVTALSKLETALRNGASILKAKDKDVITARTKLEEEFSKQSGDGAFDDELLFMNQKEFPEVAKRLNGEDENEDDDEDEDDNEEVHEDARYNEALRAAQTLRDHVQGLINGDDGFVGTYNADDVASSMKSAADEVRKVSKEFASFIKKAKKAKNVVKAVPIIQRPGVRGGHFHFNSKGKVVYERHITYNEPAHSWRGFDDVAFKRVIEEHKHVETAHQKHVKRLSEEMKELREKKRAAKPHRREAIQTKINKLRAQQVDHRAVVAAARAQRLRVSKQRVAAKKKHVAARRSVTQKKQRVVAQKRQRETIMPIGLGVGIGTRTAKEKPAPSSRTKTIESVYEDKPVAAKEPEPVVESKIEQEATKPVVIHGTTSTWKPGDENRRREVVSYKQKTSADSVENERKRAEQRAEHAKRDHERWEAQRVEREKKQETVEVTEKQPKPKKRGLLARLFGRKDAEQFKSLFVDSSNLFKVSLP